jgi:NitT/TauT family transport system substrate-binding protein
MKREKVLRGDRYELAALKLPRDLSREVETGALRMMNTIGRLLAMCLAVIAMVGLQTGAEAAETVRIATLKAGTLSWELDTISHYGLDARYGIAIAPVPVAGKQGADVMLLGGEADVIVTDWIWVARQRAVDGRDFTFIPYSRQVGGVIIPANSSAKTLADLKGKKIGVAGGPTDKSWVLLKAAAQRQGFDLATQAEPVFAAPPLLSEKLESGELDGLITFWQFAAKLKAKGMKEIVTVAEVAQELGLEPSVPLLGYVFSESWAKAHADAVRGLARASWEAKSILAKDDQAWERLRPLMDPKSDAEFEALKAGFRAGIPESDKIDEAAVAKLLGVLASAGDEEIKTLPPGTFYRAK